MLNPINHFTIWDGVMVFGDLWQIFRVSLRHGCRAIPIAWTIVEGNGLVKVNKLKSMEPIITEQIACRARLREYSFRMRIEQSLPLCAEASKCHLFSLTQVRFRKRIPEVQERRQWE